MATKVTILKKDNIKSYGIKVSTEKNGTFVVPVIDVRDGEGARKDADILQKNKRATQGSKYLQRTFGAAGGSYQAKPEKINF